MLFEDIEINVDEKKWANHPRVRVAGTLELPEAETLTSDAMKRREFRRNKPFIPRRALWYSEASRDAIRHFAEGIGDGNPLFTDPEYAKKTKYGRIVAPGCFLYGHQWTTTGGGFAGVHSWYSGGDWEWYKPVYEGTKLGSVIIIRDMAVKRGRMTGGNIYIDYGDCVYVNIETGEILGKELYHNIWAERAAAGATKKEFGKTRSRYTKGDWLRILEIMDKEEIRGAQPRYWEDVQAGDKVGPILKGPLSVRDVIAWIMGSGTTLFFRAHKMEFDFEHKHPGALEYVKELDEADVPELVHIFDEYARAIGIERAYDYGPQRMSWLCNLFTNWMGDDGFLWKMSGDERVFNQVGDVTLLGGTVVDKYVKDKRCCVDIKAWAKNQRGEFSMPPNIATVILPSRQYGPVIYPEPGASLLEEVKRARPLDELIEAGVI